MQFETHTTVPSGTPVWSALRDAFLMPVTGLIDLENLDKVSNRILVSSEAKSRKEIQGVVPDPSGSIDGTSLFNSSESAKKIGRPVSAPWHRRRKIGRRKVTRTITKAKVAELLDAARHAETIRKPLDTFATIRPDDIDEIAPEDRPAFWQAELNRVAQFCRQNGLTWTAIWSRESAHADGRGEHLHVLLHAGKHRDKLARSLAGRYPGATEIDVQPATTIAKRTSTGRHHSVIGYICKSMSPQAAWGSSMSYRAGSPVLGVRAGATRNIAAKAVVEHRERLASSQIRRMAA